MFDYTSYDAISDDKIAAAIYDAMKIKPDCIDVDLGKRDAYVKNGDIDWYHVTLSSCECRDFAISNDRKAPCKHMFRLAYELGYQLNFPELDLSKDYDPAKDLAVLHRRWADGEITFDAYKACKSALEKSVRQVRRERKKK